MRIEEVKQMMVETLTKHGWIRESATAIVNWRESYARRAGLDVADFIQRGVYLDKRP